MGVNRMRTSWRSLDPKGIEDYLKDFCKAYRGEEDNPYDVNATDDEERAIQFLRYHMWDIEKSIMEQPGYWRYLENIMAVSPAMMNQSPGRSMTLQSKSNWTDYLRWE